MNPANIAALKLLIADWAELDRPPDLAEWLAAHGVLVPSALTEDQAVKIGADAVGSVPTEPAEIALCVREGLERIASGS